jgi:MerR family redox-sensitive transcriptional activator SoxR
LDKSQQPQVREVKFELRRGLGVTGGKTDLLSIGEVARRSGVRCADGGFYEAEGLIDSVRTAGSQRFERHVLRRIAMVRAGQRFGLPLANRAALASLPMDVHRQAGLGWVSRHDRLTAQIEARPRCAK